MKTMRFLWEDTLRGPLILVNPEYALSGMGFPREVQSVSGTGSSGALSSGWGSGLSGEPLPSSGEQEEILMEREAARMLRALLHKIGSRGRIVPVSGLRSHEEQVRIWEETLAEEGEAFTRTYVAKPGHSEHESGLAIDLAEDREKIDFIRPEFPREGICMEFRRQASKYGFVERYPAGKESVTGIGGEPWHFRYVTPPHGTAMKREGLILEEYIAFLKEETSRNRPYLSFGPEENVCTEIFYLDMRGKEEEWIPCSARAEVQISGTNEGGIAVCRRRRMYG